MNRLEFICLFSIGASTQSKYLVDQKYMPPQKSLALVTYVHY